MKSGALLRSFSRFHSLFFPDSNNQKRLSSPSLELLSSFCPLLSLTFFPPSTISPSLTLSLSLFFCALLSSLSGGSPGRSGHLQFKMTKWRSSLRYEIK